MTFDVHLNLNFAEPKPKIPHAVSFPRLESTQHSLLTMYLRQVAELLKSRAPHINIAELEVVVRDDRVFLTLPETETNE